MNDRRKRYREKHKEQIAAYKKLYREKNAQKTKKYSKEYYSKNKESISEKHHEYYEAHKDDIIEQHKEYVSNHKDTVRKNARKWQQKNKDKVKSKYGGAHSKVKHAIELGIIEKRQCEECGRVPAQAHHDDYNKPLEVRWLCRSCHRMWHKNNNPKFIEEAHE